ncbi:putative ABC transporter permease protein [Caldilinea aerophila DSM 14535 = NBRC 104270]|uniref:Putative ABC transporter permease protein n=1 Tax=Caldilinea aerophila (strain DSM 14535 / JCM 11387 / NBRC 104270 / STL-6-O1) TaxID=926550 RepID=I0I0Z0_CALAS|nr:putative ABC transporter permease protein [Caldilinea aerophila DSM 14535 = NBRC 104270]
MSLVVIFILAPVAWLAISSVAPPKDLLTRPPRWVPWPPDFSNYYQLLWGAGEKGTTLTAFTLRAFRFSLRNSMIVASGVTLMCLVLGTLASYAFARLRIPLGQRLLYLFLLVQMVPVIVLLIPMFLVVTRLGLLDRLETVILLLTAFHLPFVIWILRSYFLSLPIDLEEAALVDGASRLQVIRHIVLPLAIPGLFAAAVYTFMQTWNAFMIPLIFTSSETQRTVTVAIAMFVGRHYTEYGLISAAGVLASLPPALLAIFFQRYLLAGLTAGAVKG